MLSRKTFLIQILCLKHFASSKSLSMSQAVHFIMSRHRQPRQRHA